MATVIITGLEELRQRMRQWPDKFNAVMVKTMEASLYKLSENTPEYPPEPAGSSYTRTEQLGRSLDVGGPGNIHEVKQTGGYVEGEFGTNLGYAQYPIGEQQAWMHKGHWWRLVDVLEKSIGDIEKLFQTAADEMARWLDGKGA